MLTGPNEPDSENPPSKSHTRLFHIFAIYFGSVGFHGAVNMGGRRQVGYGLNQVSTPFPMWRLSLDTVEREIAKHRGQTVGGRDVALQKHVWLVKLYLGLAKENQLTLLIARLVQKETHEICLKEKLGVLTPTRSLQRDPASFHLLLVESWDLSFHKFIEANWSPLCSRVSSI